MKKAYRILEDKQETFIEVIDDRLIIETERHEDGIIRKEITVPLKQFVKIIQKLAGSQGGQKTASLYGKEHFSKIAKGWPKGKKRKKKVETEA